jgi:antigen flippase
VGASATSGVFHMILSKANFGTFSASFAIQACGAVTGVLTARLLGPVARGEFATVLLWPTILSNLGLMGCNWVLARAVAKYPQRERDWVSSGLAVGLTMALLYFLAGYFLIARLLPPDRGYLLPVARLCLFLIPLDICSQILLAVEQGRMRWRRFNLLRVSFFLFYVVLVGLLGVTHRARVNWFVLAFLASHLLAALLRLWAQRKSVFTGKFRTEQCRHLLTTGVPYWGATASNLITLQLDTILVISLLSAQAAGIYAVASTFAAAQASIGEALGMTSFAIISNESDPRSRESVLTRTFRQSALVSSGTGLVLACLVPFVVKPLFGSGFSRAIGPAMILALAASVTTSANILNQGLRGAGRPHAGIMSQLLGAGVMALAAAFFLRRFGLIGMAWAVSLSACAQVVVLVASAANWLRISPLCFWPFGAREVRLFWQQVAALRFVVSRSPA